jgi:glycosyltransferase involved in cell wall biosynthesis
MVIVTLPAFNEESTLPKLLHAIREAMDENAIEYRAVIVNDGITESTAEIVGKMREQMPIARVEQERNLVLGEAILTGLLHPIEEAEDRDILVTMGSDNTRSPGLIARMVRGIRERNDVGIASRYRFIVSIAERGELRPLGSKEVAFDEDNPGRRWSPFEVDLSQYAGRRVTLRLEAIPSPPGRRGGVALFGSPRILLPPE